MAAIADDVYDRAGQRGTRALIANGAGGRRQRADRDAGRRTGDTRDLKPGRLARLGVSADRREGDLDRRFKVVVVTDRRLPRRASGNPFLS